MQTEFCLDGLARQSGEGILNPLLNAEADAVCRAGRREFPGRPFRDDAGRSGVEAFPATRRGSRQCMKICKLYEAGV